MKVEKTVIIELSNKEIEQLKMMAELARLYIKQEQENFGSRDRSTDVSHYSCGEIQHLEAELMEGIFSL